MDNSIKNVSFGANLIAPAGHNGVMKEIAKKFEAKTANMPGTLMLKRGKKALGEDPESKYFQIAGSDCQMYLDCDEFLATKTGKHTKKQQDKLVNKLIRIFKILQITDSAEKLDATLEKNILDKICLSHKHRQLARTSKTDIMRNRFYFLLEQDKIKALNLQKEKETKWKEAIDKMYKIAKNDDDISNDYIAAIE